MTLTRWSPLGGLAALEVDRLNRMFEVAFGADVASGAAWVPATDILETPDQTVVVKIDLPDVKREDINVTYENNVLTVEGERKVAAVNEGERYHRVERGHGRFRRAFTLPSSLDAGKIGASFENGVLTITLPRREETKPRQIQING